MQKLVMVLLLVSGVAQAEIEFSCQPEKHALLNSIKVVNGRVALSGDNTLKISKQYRLKDEKIRLPVGKGKFRIVSTVSKMEIVMAMAHGQRKFSYSGSDCGLSRFVDDVLYRQNVVAWTENLNWNFPESSAAKWHATYWTDGGDLLDNRQAQSAIADMFSNRESYAVGCYTTAKAIYMQAAFDLFSRIRPDQEKLGKLNNKLLADNEIWKDIEPTSFATIDDERSRTEPVNNGKLLVYEKGVETLHFVPGDWVYFMNPDPLSRTKNGYEGSNAIYLGRNRFNDYYNGNDGFFPFEEKIDQVYQWRNAVYNWTRDAGKIDPITPTRMEQLVKSPVHGGLLMMQRARPVLPE